jgi:RNA polymerase sigma-70 factor, ECF subfamily
MAQYQQGNAAAIEELVLLLSPLLYRFLSHVNYGRDDIEDLFQDCWLRIHKARHTYRVSEPVLPWVFAIARHTSVDCYRRRRRVESRELRVERVPEPALSAPEPGSPNQDEFSRLLECLPESQREVILMLKVSGMSLEEVARATSSTVGAVKQKAHRAYEKLRHALGGA